MTPAVSWCGANDSRAVLRVREENEDMVGLKVVCCAAF